MLDQNIMLLLSDAEVTKQKVLIAEVEDRDAIFFATPKDVVDTETIQYENQESIGMIKQNEIDVKIYAGQKYNIPVGKNVGRVIYASLEEQTKGNAISSDIKPGKTIYVNGQKITGNMRVLENIIIDTITYVDDHTFYISPFENAFYNSPIVSSCGVSNYLYHIGIDDSDLRKGFLLCNIQGIFASDANATESDVIAGNKFFTADGEFTGSLELDSLF